jgi:hypothetical protein
MFELWSSEISGPRTSAYYRETLNRVMTGPKPLTHDERKAAEATLSGYPAHTVLDGFRSRSLCSSFAVIYKRRTTALNPTNNWALEKVGR